MACKNCKCDEKKADDTSVTRNGDIDLSKYTHIEFHKDLEKEVKAIHRFLRLKFPELTKGAIYWSNKKYVDEQILKDREYKIQDLRSQGYLVEAPQSGVIED